MRPGEVCILKACDIDRSGDVWTFQPRTHKTVHHGRSRFIFIGPRGQKILEPYLASMEDDGFIFRPDAAERVRNSLRKAGRQSPRRPARRTERRRMHPRRPLASDISGQATPGRLTERAAWPRSPNGPRTNSGITRPLNCENCMASKALELSLAIAPRT